MLSRFGQDVYHRAPLATNIDPNEPGDRSEESSTLTICYEGQDGDTSDGRHFGFWISAGGTIAISPRAPERVGVDVISLPPPPAQRSPKADPTSSTATLDDQYPHPNSSPQAANTTHGHDDQPSYPATQRPGHESAETLEPLEVGRRRLVEREAIYSDLFLMEIVLPDLLQSREHFGLIGWCQ